MIGGHKLNYTEHFSASFIRYRACSSVHEEDFEPYCPIAKPANTDDRTAVYNNVYIIWVNINHLTITQTKATLPHVSLCPFLDVVKISNMC